jgi:hypothetical protein
MTIISLCAGIILRKHHKKKKNLKRYFFYPQIIHTFAAIWYTSLIKVAPYLYM